ncbi:MAG: helix-turn-helix transcriptional regulator [Methanobrevibacter sp.]|uniref:helix-turn-helix domain-containing protein n=1 Tax=Methanobrevibacter sp. TaxID=66852 RepID=UPI002E77AD31|nr:helix-turn-helix transcriptional regulator [Methanobrevibacter sp.]MEE0942218.1 helix-turn-helix transcriptional regulator [Methanobrevibacter sp.]
MEDRGERLRRLRTEKGLTSHDLSKYLEISQEDVENLENNEGKLNLTILTKLSDLYCCSERYLLCMSDEYEPMAYAFRSDNHTVDDLNAIAKINQIYKNMEFLLKKEQELEN